MDTRIPTISEKPERSLPFLKQWGLWPARALGLLALLALGLAAGLIAARYGLTLPLGILAGLVLAVGAFFSPAAGFLLATLFAVLLPFGVLPVRFVLTPSYLELALLGALAGWFLPPLVRGDRRWRFSALDALAWAFVALTLFSLVLGLGRGVDTTVLHNYAKLLLGLLAFFGVRQVVTGGKHLRRSLTVFLLAAGLAALLGLFLHVLPDRLALDLLTRLEVVGYPSQGRVLRYVEDDPGGLERAIGTSVDPNSFGGMLALAAAIALGEVLHALPRGVRPRGGAGTEPGKEGQVPLPLPLLLLILALLVACLYLTYSRAALGGLVVAVLFLATVRYRRLWWAILPLAVVVAVVLAAGGAHPVLERFRQGLAFQDLANQMRLAEFANAAAIIERYPVFGVGFFGAPDVDLSTGVSSLYLTVAERMGLLGILAFLAFVGTALVQGLRSTTSASAEQRSSITSGHRLALLAGVVAALAIGVLDHYFFNLEFPHMAALLWMTLGLLTVDKLDADHHA